jgi:hypothetical protein
MSGSAPAISSWRGRSRRYAVLTEIADVIRRHD